MNTTELINEACSLPVDERVRIVDSLLQSLNPVDADIAAEWARVARERMREIDNGAVQTIPGDQVFAEARARLAQR
jgi:putative addiction module component (TIGR02574 family)